MKRNFSLLHAFVLCMSALIICVLLTIAPLNRLAGTTLLSSVSLFMLLTGVGTKLPTDLHLTTNVHASQINTDTIEFLSLMLLIYLLYALSVYLIQRCAVTGTRSTLTTGHTPDQSLRRLLRLIWIGAVLIGVIYVLAPVMLSRDIAAYASYGRIIMIYHANPYYTMPAAFPNDPILQASDWQNVVAAYGPVWLAVCAISTLIAGNSLLHYILFYRILGLAAHFVDIALVTAILHKMGSPPRVVIIGTLLYAWNPLVLLESCMSGHNDIEMVTCILLGVLLCLHTEHDNFIHTRFHLPPMLAFTCAALIKFTATPVIVFYLVLLARHIFMNSSCLQQSLWARWLRVIGLIARTALISLIISSVLYTPLWLGQTPQAIIASLGSPPASRLAFGSILLALQKVAIAHQLDTHFLFLSLHSTWNIINAFVVISLSGIGAVCLWRVPTTRTMVQATLSTLGALLIVTPWFFPWYIVWIVGLAAVSVPIHREYLGRALMSATFVFSASALFIYLFRGYPPIGDWIGFTSLTTVGPPVVVFLFLLLSRNPASRTPIKAPNLVETTNQLVP